MGESKTKLYRLTDRQAAVVDYIVEIIRDHHPPPTLREIGDRLGIESTNAVRCHLIALEKKGWIACAAGKARGIVLTARARAHYGLALAGDRDIAVIERIRTLCASAPDGIDLSTSAGAAQGADTMARAILRILDGGSEVT